MVDDRPRDEDRLVARAKRGDAAAYAELVHAHESIAFRTAWLITGSAAEAEEAAQDAFLKAHRSLQAGVARDRSPSPEAALLEGEQRAELLAAVERLPDRDRTVIACRYFLE